MATNKNDFTSIDQRKTKYSWTRRFQVKRKKTKQFKCFPSFLIIIYMHRHFVGVVVDDNKLEDMSVEMINFLSENNI